MTGSTMPLASFDFPRGSAIEAVTHEIEAPADLVYELMAAIGQGRQADDDGSTVLERAGNDLVCEFWTTVPIPLVGRRVLRTREAVRLLPPNALAFRHLDGPVRGLTERIRVDSLDDRRSRVTYEAVLPGSGLLHWIRFQLARSPIERAVAEHFADIGARAAARASRSRVHGNGDTPTRAATAG